ncbi:MAG: hypothetical protein QNJ30_21335 [Kiloniellales bacterium]|nr:hypothetical protein [Kiloniellales bacterium]
MPNFLQTLIRPDQDENEDRALIAHAANILEIGEFQLLQLAYYEWHGCDMPEAQTDTIFHGFMMQNRVPHWAKHFARRVLEHEERDELNARHPYFHRYDSEYHRAAALGSRRLAIALCVIMLAVGGGILVSHFATHGTAATATRAAPVDTAKPSAPATSVTPPFFSEEELRPTPRTDLRGS